MAQRLASRVLLIGWDAADWQMIDPLLEAGRMPSLERFITAGVMGNVATLHPVISPILWNSIATGKRADKHGILGFVEPDGDGGIRPVSSTSRKAKALWNILSQSGLRSCVVGWYASHPAEPVNGVVVSDRYQRSADPHGAPTAPDPRAIHPPELAQTLLDLRVGVNDITPEQVLPFIPQAHRIDQKSDVRLAALCELLAECATIHNAATWLIEHETWDFMAVYYDAIDHFGHGFMEYHPPKMEHVSDEDFKLYRHVMNGCYQFHDMLLGRLMELAGPETTIILLSDHGFRSGVLRPRLASDPTNPKRKVGPGVNPVAWHRQHGVLALNGPLIKHDERVHGASLLDVAPTVLTLLGLPVPDDMDGKPLTQIFVAPVQPERIATYEGEHERDGVHRGEFADDPFARQLVLRNLIELGYIDAPGDDQAAAVEQTLRDRRQNLAQVLFSAGRTQEAHDHLAALLAQEDHPHLRCRLAMCQIGLGRLEEAEATLSPVAEGPLDYPLATMLFGQILLLRRRYDEALALLEKARNSNPELPHLHVYLGRIYMRQQRYDLAEQSFRRALEIDADDAEAHDGLGVALRHQGRMQDAVFEHMSSASLEHHRAETHANLGVALAALGKVDWAIQAFRIASELAPRHPFPHRCLARLFKRAKGDLESARRHARRALELRAALRAK